MTQELRIGRVGRKHFHLPAEIATQALAIHGVRGKGKTVTASVIIEELLTIGVQVVVIDPTDVWWGLRSSADGKKPGHDVVILGGSHGDLPLLSTSGRVIADFAVDRGASLILSLRHLRKAEQRRFVTEFAEQLFHRKGQVEHRTPLFLAIDEASQYVPQRVMGDSARMVGAIQDIVRLGRSAGLGCALIDQRPATVNKDVLTQIELLVCHAVTAPQDRKALTEWIRQKDSAGREGEFLEDLASLDRGEAWFWHPIHDVFQRVAVRMRETFDSSKTPELGAAAAAPEVGAEIDLEELRGALEATVAEAEANDPKALKRRIKELEKGLRSADRGPSPEEVEAEVERRVSDSLVRMHAGLRASIDEATAIVARLESLLEEKASIVESRFPDSPKRVPPPQPVDRHPRSGDGSRRPAPGASNLVRGEAMILAAVAQHPEGVTRKQLSVLTTYRRSSRDTYLQRLRSKGLVEPRGGIIVATDAGLDVLGPDFERLPTGDELLEYWLNELSGGEQVILQVVANAWPNSIDRAEISERTSYKRSSRDTYLQKLAARQLIEREPGGAVRASEDLFG